MNKNKIIDFTLDPNCDNDYLKIRNTTYYKRELSPREKQVARLLSIGLSRNEIAAKLNVSPITIRNITTNIMNKINVDTTLKIALAVAYNEIEVD